MPRYNVMHPITHRWRCFSSVIDDWITGWMEEEEYQAWRIEEYGKKAGDLYSANRMSYTEAKEAIAFRLERESEDEAVDECE